MPAPDPETFKSLYTILHEMVETHGISYMDACVAYAEQTGIEVELIGDIIASEPLLKAKIREEATALNFLKRDA